MFGLGKKKKCDKGSSCGASCISQEKTCEVTFGGKIQAPLSKRADFLSKSVIGGPDNPSSLDKAAKKAAKLMGVSKEEGYKVVEGVRYFTREDGYKAVRALDKGGDALEKYVASEDLPPSFASKLRKGKPQEYTEAINKMLNSPKVPRYDGEIYRGLSSKFLETNSLEPGTEFSLQAMSSFSSNQKIAERFAGGSEGVVIKVKQNTQGVSIKNISTFAEEDEVLVPKNTKYRVVSVEGNVYTVEEV